MSSLSEAEFNSVLQDLLSPEYPMSDSSPSSILSDESVVGLIPEDSLFQNINLGSDILSSFNFGESCAIPSPSGDSIFNNIPTTESLVGKKRKIRPQSPNAVGTLDKETLSSVSSIAKLDEMVKSVQQERELTKDEQTQLKKHRRLIRNRESAQLSRQKKKQYVSDLEERIRRLENENMNLKNEVSQLKSQLGDKSLLAPGSTPKIFNKKSASAAGICLFVILFSIGLLFNVHPAPVTDIGTSNLRTFHQGRTLSEFKEQLPAIEAPTTLSTFTSKRAHNDYDEIFPDFTYQNDFNSPWIIHEPFDDLPAIAEPIDNSRLVIGDAISSSDGSYIYCSEAHEVVNDDVPVISSVNNERPTITILLPANVLNSSLPYVDDIVVESGYPEDTLFEVSCQILNVALSSVIPSVEQIIPQSIVS